MLRITDTVALDNAISVHDCFVAQVRSLTMILALILVTCPLSLAQSESALASNAVEAMQAGNYSEAEKCFSRLAELMPNIPELYSNLGLAYYYQNKYSLARQSFEKALSLKHDLFVPNLFLARLDQEEARYREALPFVQAAVEIAPKDVDARRLLAEIQLQLGAYTSSIQNYERLIKFNSNDEKALYGISRAYAKEARGLALSLKSADPRFFLLTKAESAQATSEGSQLDELSHAISLLPNVPLIRMHLAEVLLQRHAITQARSALLREVELDSKNYEALFLLADCSLLSGEDTSAIEFIDRAARIRPEYFESLLPLPEYPQNLEDVYSRLSSTSGKSTFARSYLLSVVARKMGRSEECDRWSKPAKEWLNQFLSAFHNAEPPAEATGGHPISKGLDDLRQKRFEAGLQLLSSLNTADITDRTDILLILRSMIEMGQFRKAVSVFRNSRFRQDPECIYLLVNTYKALEIRTIEQLANVNPGSVDLLKMRAESFADREMYKEAEGAYSEALQEHPDVADLYFGLGEAYFNQMRFEKAEQSYARAMDLLPSDPTYYVMRAQTLMELQRPDEAIPFAKQAISLNPGLLQAHVALGRAYSLVGRDKEAITELEMGSGLDHDGMLHYKLFQLYKKVGESDRAKQALQISLALKRRGNSSSDVLPDGMATSPH